MMAASATGRACYHHFLSEVARNRPVARRVAPEPVEELYIPCYPLGTLLELKRGGRNH